MLNETPRWPKADARCLCEPILNSPALRLINTDGTWLPDTLLSSCPSLETQKEKAACFSKSSVIPRQNDPKFMVKSLRVIFICNQVCLPRRMRSEVDVSYKVQFFIPCYLQMFFSPFCCVSLFCC